MAPARQKVLFDYSSRERKGEVKSEKRNRVGEFSELFRSIELLQPMIEQQEVQKISRKGGCGDP